MKHIYMSTTETVEVRILTGSGGKSKYFLVDYQCKYIMEVDFSLNKDIV